MIIYLSGPITNCREARYMFSAAERALKRGGYEVVNPEAMLRGLTMEHKDYLHVCRALLEVADAMVLLPGWKKSIGACIEVGIASQRNIRIAEMKTIGGPPEEFKL